MTDYGMTELGHFRKLLLLFTPHQPVGIWNPTSFFCVGSSELLLNLKRQRSKAKHLNFNVTYTQN